MRASVDTNVLIHLYRAEHQHILFDLFDEGVIIFEQIRNVELMHHGKEVLQTIDDDIHLQKIQLYTLQDLKRLSVDSLFNHYVRENRGLYGTGDLGEVYAISLAQTLGAYSLVTDDIKQGGPYMSLLHFEDDVMPFTFSDVVILLYLVGKCDVQQAVRTFNDINKSSSLNWSFNSHLSRFIRRFFSDPYREEDTKWMNDLVIKKNIKIRSMLYALRDEINRQTS